MGLCNSPEIFQEKMSKLFVGLNTVRVTSITFCMLQKSLGNNILLSSKRCSTASRRLGSRSTPENLALAPTNFDYLGYHVTRDGVMPIPKKVEAIQALAVPKTRKQFRQFIGMINFYRDMWQKRSELLAPLTALTSKNIKYDWKDEHQKCFDAIKRVIGREVLLAYPDFNAFFEMHTDDSKLQIGAVISQKGKPIAFYSRNMNSAQHNYTTTEKKLLSILATLKEFRNIILGRQITVYTGLADP